MYDNVLWGKNSLANVRICFGSIEQTNLYTEILLTRSHYNFVTASKLNQIEEHFCFHTNKQLHYYVQLFIPAVNFSLLHGHVDDLFTAAAIISSNPKTT